MRIPLFTLLTAVGLALFGCGSPTEESGQSEGASTAANERPSPTLVNELPDAPQQSDRSIRGTETPDAAAVALTGTVRGCPSGYACIYPRDKGWNNNSPSNKYYTYGCHRLYDQYGTHRVFNNQTGGAYVLLFKTSDCSGTGIVLPYPISSRYLSAGRSVDVDLTPINAIYLEP